MKLKLNRVPTTAASSAPASAPTSPALKQIFQRLAAAGAPMQKAA